MKRTLSSHLQKERDRDHGRTDWLSIPPKLGCQRCPGKALTLVVSSGIIPLPCLTSVLRPCIISATEVVPAVSQNADKCSQSHQCKSWLISAYRQMAYTTHRGCRRSWSAASSTTPRERSSSTCSCFRLWVISTRGLRAHLLIDMGCLSGAPDL
jgi:hypothetical protein